MKYILILLSFFFVSSINAAEVDLNNSDLSWYGSKVGGEHFGKLTLKEAKLEEKNGEVIGGEFIIDINSMTVENIDSPTYEEKFLNHMKSADFFDTEKYPTAKLKIEKINADIIEGKLTIKDKTNSIQFPIKREGDIVSGKMIFDRTKYDMIYRSKNFFKDLGDKIINDEVILDFKIRIISG